MPSDLSVIHLLMWSRFFILCLTLTLRKAVRIKPRLYTRSPFSSGTAFHPVIIMKDRLENTYFSFY